MANDKVSDLDRLTGTRYLAVMLQADPAKRPPTMAEVLAHPFFPKDEQDALDEHGEWICSQPRVLSLN